MNRNYTKEEFLTLANKIRERIPDVAITTDIIVGFPGETAADVDDTIDVINKVKFDNAFTYIQREQALLQLSLRIRYPKAKLRRILTGYLRLFRKPPKSKLQSLSEDAKMFLLKE